MKWNQRFSVESQVVRSEDPPEYGKKRRPEWLGDLTEEEMNGLIRGTLEPDLERAKSSALKMSYFDKNGDLCLDCGDDEIDRILEGVELIAPALESIGATEVDGPPSPYLSFVLGETVWTGTIDCAVDAPYCNEVQLKCYLGRISPNERAEQVLKELSDMHIDWRVWVHDECHVVACLRLAIDWSVEMSSQLAGKRWVEKFVPWSEQFFKVQKDLKFNYFLEPDLRGADEVLEKFRFQ
jgi:hypothetical protein